MVSVEVSEATFRTLQLAGRLTGMSTSQVIDRLVMQSSPQDGDSAASPVENQVPIFADYNGQRVKALYSKETHRIDITSGSLAGTRHKSPSAAARAVVSAEKPTVNSNRNGWGFWYLDDDSGRLLQEIRYDG